MKISGKQILDELKTPALIILGMAGGNLAGNIIDKTLKVDNTQEGFNIKKIVKPIVQISAGLSGTLLLKNENLKLISVGVTASGVASTVKVLLKKDLLNGFKGLGEAEVLKQFRENLKLQRYNPNLPELSELSELNNIETIPIEMSNSGRFEDYQEIDEIEII